VAAFGHLVGSHRDRVYRSRLKRTYSPLFISDVSFSVRDEHGEIRLLECATAQDWACDGLLCDECSVFSFLAGDFPAAQHTMVPAMGDDRPIEHGFDSQFG